MMSENRDDSENNRPDLKNLVIIYFLTLVFWIVTNKLNRQIIC